MSKHEKASGKGGTLHVEIVRANWDRLKSQLDTYNSDPGRLTPPLKPADIINAALVEFLKGDKKKNGKK